MNFKVATSCIDNSIIDKLTKITWEVEVRFNKDNIYLSAIFLTLAHLFFLCAFSIGSIEFYKGGHLFLAVIWAILSAMIGYGVVDIIYDQRSLRKTITRIYPQGCPNPSRQWTGTKTRVSILTFICIFYVVYINSLSSVILFFLITFVCLLLHIYLAACDSIPPSEKARRKAKNEAGSRDLAL